MGALNQYDENECRYRRPQAREGPEQAPDPEPVPSNVNTQEADRESDRDGNDDLDGLPRYELSHRILKKPHGEAERHSPSPIKEDRNETSKKQRGERGGQWEPDSGFSSFGPLAARASAQRNPATSATRVTGIHHGLRK